jgi:hypothetical protein
MTWVLRSKPYRPSSANSLSPAVINSHRPRHPLLGQVTQSSYARKCIPATHPSTHLSCVFCPCVYSSEGDYPLSAVAANSRRRVHTTVRLANSDQVVSLADITSFPVYQG